MTDSSLTFNDRANVIAGDKLSGRVALVSARLRGSGAATMRSPASQDWDKVPSVSLSGSFYMAQPALEHMAERGTGRIISMASVIGETGNVGQANYAASKAGMLGLTKTLAREAAFVLAKADKQADDSVGITVNTVTPGFVATDMVAAMPEKALDRIRKQIPVGRLCRPEEIARVVHFLAADASAYITGQVWGVNGGMDM